MAATEYNEKELGRLSMIELVEIPSASYYKGSLLVLRLVLFNMPYTLSDEKLLQHSI